jgi:hypothetical protein
MVFNTTFNYISVISWRSVLLVEETEVPGPVIISVTYNLPVTFSDLHLKFMIHLQFVSVFHKLPVFFFLSSISYL